MIQQINPVVNSFGYDVGIMSFFGRFKSAKMNVFLADLYGCLPLVVPKLLCPNKLCSAIASYLVLVLAIYRSRNIPKVANPVVVFDAVDVVNVAIGEHPVAVQPSKTMGFISNTVNSCSVVTACLVKTSRNFPGKVSSRRSDPSKQTSVRIVMKQLFESFLREDRMLFSHAVSPVKKWFGQKPQSVSALLGLRHFNMGVA